MYARQVSISSSPEHRAKAEALADMIYTTAKSLKGFVSMHFLIAEDESAYGSLSLWDTHANAASAAEILREKGAAAMQEIATAPPEISVYEVYKPKS